MTYIATKRLPQTRRVLLAGDDHTLRLQLGKVMGSAGFDVTYAESGNSTLKLFDYARGRFDLLIADTCMPETSGSALVHAIRQRDQDIPIIAITDLVRPELLSEIASCNGRLFEKPVNVKSMCTHIDTLQLI